jgi:hypothetical protein
LNIFTVVHPVEKFSILIYYHFERVLIKESMSSGLTSLPSASKISTHFPFWSSFPLQRSA